MLSPLIMLSATDSAAAAGARATEQSVGVSGSFVLFATCMWHHAVWPMLQARLAGVCASAGGECGCQQSCVRQLPPVSSNWSSGCCRLGRPDSTAAASSADCRTGDTDNHHLQHMMRSSAIVHVAVRPAAQQLQLPSCWCPPHLHSRPPLAQLRQPLPVLGNALDVLIYVCRPNQRYITRI